jgi:hypothetical protein
MKIKLLAIIALFISVVTQAQTTQPSSKVASAFTQEELNGKSEMDIRYMNFVADKGFVMHQAGKEGAFYPNLSSVLKVQFGGMPVNTLTTETFNPFMVNSSRDTHQFFKIDGTDMVVQIYSDSYATTIFSDFLINERNKARK